MKTQGCQGPECRDGILHKSDCAIHNGDALPVGPCDCGAAPSAQDSAAPSSVSAEPVVLQLIVEALEQSEPKAGHYPEPRARHEAALKAARALAQPQPGMGSGQS